MPIEHAKFLCKKGEVCLLSGARGDAIGSLEAARKLATELQVSGDSEVGQAIEELEALLSG